MFIELQNMINNYVVVAEFPNYQYESSSYNYVLHKHYHCDLSNSGASKLLTAAVIY